MKHLIILLLIVINSSVGFAAEGGAYIGSVKTVSGSCFVIRQSETMPAVVGLRLIRQDILQTGKNSYMGIILKDNSLLSIGSETKLELSSFDFDPNEKKLGFTSRLIRGTLVYLTGIMTKLNKDSVKFITPTAVVGVRGTKIAIKAE